MSATGRSDVRIEADFYSTPTWATHAIRDQLQPFLPVGRWLEPACGDLALVKAFGPGNWTAYDIRGKPSVDFLETPVAMAYDLLITNPPFSLWQAFAEHGLKVAKEVVLLGRLNLLASKKRWAFWHRQPLPDVYVLPNRPSFTGNGTDATEYAWFHWNGYSHGRYLILPLRDT
jgi:hypothetical protein